MNVKHLGLAVGASAAVVLSSCSDDDSNKKVLTGDQTGTITVDLEDGGSLSFTQPPQIKLSGTATYDDPTDTVTISLTLKNGSKSVLHNPKAVFTNLSEGTITGDGTFGALVTEGSAPPFVYFGPESIAPGGTATQDVVVDSVTGVDPELTMDVEILVHPWFVLPGGDDGVVTTDSSGAGLDLFLGGLAEPTGWGGGGVPDSWTRADAKSPDGRFVYYTNRSQPTIITYDTVELTFELGESYMGGTIAHDGTGVIGFIDGLTPSRDGEHIYAVLNHGVHTNPHGGSMAPTPEMIELLKLKATNLSVVDRITIWEPTAPPVEGGSPPDVRGRRMGLNVDGTFGAVAIQNDAQVVLIDLTDMSVVDADDATEGAQGFTTVTPTPRHAVPSADGSTIFIAYNDIDPAADGTLEQLDVATGTSTDLVPDTVSAGDNQPTFLEFGPDGRLYYGRAYDGTVPGLSIFDFTDDTWTEIAGSMTAITFRADAYYVWDDDALEVRGFDYTDVELTFPGSGTTGIPNSDESFGHGLVLTDAD